MAELERDLRALGAAIELPAERALVPGVRARLAEPSLAHWAWLRPLALALVLAVVALGIAFTVPDARSAILRFLGLQGVRIEFVQKLPEVPIATTLDLGERTTLEEARSHLSYRVLTSPLLGSPDAVYLRSEVLWLLYGSPARPRLLLTEFRGSVRPDFFKKIAGPETRVESLSVDGGPGFWISGARHLLVVGSAGEIRDDTVWLARNTLLWQRGSLTVRLEGGLTRAQALRIARSLD